MVMSPGYLRPVPPDEPYHPINRRTWEEYARLQELPSAFAIGTEDEDDAQRLVIADIYEALTTIDEHDTEMEELLVAQEAAAIYGINLLHRLSVDEPPAESHCSRWV